ncbi:MAG: outer membrane lipoprotein-sorting protein [Candidatus Azotimanducaceae bacterium]
MKIMVSCSLRLFLLMSLAFSAAVKAEENFDPLNLVTQSIDQTRGLSSYSEMTMLIKRPSWQRESTLYAWTRGRDDALIRFVAPARDAGNALLKQGDKMWTFNPKLNKSIRLPGGMMSQSWAGSDFSYDDMSRSDKWIKHYRLEHVDTEEIDGLKTYTIDAIPFDDAPVVWGKERLRIREDAVLIEAIYYDQDMQPLRRMVSTEIGTLGGRMMATTMRMLDLEKPDSFTEVRYDAMDFDVALQDRLFTLFSLQSRNR